MKKKVSLTLVLILLFASISFGIGKNYFAKAQESNDFVIGTKNLNDTPQNSAKIGDLLNEPEIGWKRYDDRNEKILYLGGWDKQQADYSFNKTYTYYSSKDPSSAQRASFKFYGTKFRIMGGMFFNASNGVKVFIDGKITDSFNQCINPSLPGPVLLYEKIGLEEGRHEVRIYMDSTTEAKGSMGYKYCQIDAIDIDGNGELKPYDEKEIESESISLNKNSLDLLEEKSEKLIATIKPDDATNKKIIWSSSDEAIAKVDENGNVTAIKEGKATITAKIENTNLTATCTVNVKKPIEENKNNAILSISLVNGATKEYDVSMEEVDKFINWFEEKSNGKGPSTYSFNKKISPYKSVKEYIVHDKIASFEVKEYETVK